MKNAIGLLLAPICAVFVVSLLVTPQPKIQHQDSSAFQMALQQAVDRLEGGGKVLLAGTATPAKADPQQPTFDSRYTCETYDPGWPTCDPAAGCFPHTADPAGHTCIQGEYTCQMFTCETYDPLAATCDPNSPNCAFPHTSEPAPFNHTCQGHTCDGTFTCDFTIDPRALTCDAADPQCELPTFNIWTITCNPMLPECRQNNPNGYCTGDTYPTCQPSVPTCDQSDPLCATVNPHDPVCGTPTEHTTWGKVKLQYQDR